MFSSLFSLSTHPTTQLIMPTLHCRERRTASPSLATQPHTHNCRRRDDERGLTLSVRDVSESYAMKFLLFSLVRSHPETGNCGGTKLPITHDKPEPHKYTHTEISAKTEPTPSLLRLSNNVAIFIMTKYTDI